MMGPDQSEFVNEAMVEAAAHAMISCGEAMDDEHMRAAFRMGDRYVARKILEAALAASVALNAIGDLITAIGDLITKTAEQANALALHEAIHDFDDIGAGAGVNIRLRALQDAKAAVITAGLREHEERKAASDKERER